MKIGVLGHGFIEWDGGIDFLRTVCESLAAADHPVELHVLIPTRGPRVVVHGLNLRLRRIAKRLLGQAAAPRHAPNLHDLSGPIADAGPTIRIHEIDLGSAAMRRAFRQLQLDILLPSFDTLTFGVEIPWLGYLCDMQHKYLPHFFSPSELAQRDLAFGRMLREARAVIVNSRTVATDIRTHFPAASAQVVALPFSAAPLPAWFELDPDVVRAKYSVGPNYFIICNQFWKHKDHGTAFKAFAALARIHPELQLVCTGATSDYRDPHHFARLQQLLSELGIEDRVTILGCIPKPDQIALVRGSVALIQPTMFEGGPGGGAVYDAVALGVPCVVSDVPVNLEIDEAGVRFFKSRDPASLREVMSLSYAEFDTLVPPPAAELLARGRARRKVCGNVLVQGAMMVMEQAAATSI
jgi:glycosyltransferase involved in cell wall biosynthesis